MFAEQKTFRWSRTLFQNRQKETSRECKIGICDNIVNEAGIFCDGPAFQKPPGDCRLRLEVLSPDAAAFDAIL